MTERLISGLSHCEHLVFIEGSSAAIDLLMPRAAGSEAGQVRLDKLLPPPPGLTDLDPLTIAHFQLMNGMFEAAKQSFAEMGETMPLDDAGQPLLSQEVISDSLRVSLHLQQFGAPDRRSWKRDNWGSAATPSITAHREADDVLLLKWQAESSFWPACVRMVNKLLELTVGAVYVDFTKKVQNWMLRPEGQRELVYCPSSSMGFPDSADFVKLHIDNLPAQFRRAG